MFFCFCSFFIFGWLSSGKCSPKLFGGGKWNRNWSFAFGPFQYSSGLSMSQNPTIYWDRNKSWERMTKTWITVWENKTWLLMNLKYQSSILFSPLPFLFYQFEILVGFPNLANEHIHHLTHLSFSLCLVRTFRKFQFLQYNVLNCSHHVLHEILRLYLMWFRCDSQFWSIYCGGCSPGHTDRQWEPWLSTLGFTYYWVN